MHYTQYLKPLYAPFWLVGNTVTFGKLQYMLTADLNYLAKGVTGLGRDVGEITRPLWGDQDQGSVPQVPLQGHGVALGRHNLARKELWP